MDVAIQGDDRVVALSTELRLEADEHALLVTHGYWRAWMWVTWLIIPAAVVRAQRRRSTLVVTERRVLSETGIARKTRQVIRRTAVRDVRIRQGRVARRYDAGDLVIEIAGLSQPVRIRHVDGVRAFRNIILSPLTAFAPAREPEAWERP